MTYLTVPTTDCGEAPPLVMVTDPLTAQVGAHSLLGDSSRVLTKVGVQPCLLTRVMPSVEGFGCARPTTLLRRRPAPRRVVWVPAATGSPCLAPCLGSPRRQSDRTGCPKPHCVFVGISRKTKVRGTSRALHAHASCVVS